jgi:PKD repeat protein
MKKYFTLLLTILAIITQAQKPISETNTTDLFGTKGEIYFLLQGAATHANELTKIISIDKVENGDVYAYASVKEYNKLKAGFNFNLILLPKPGELTFENVSSSVREIMEWDTYPTYQGYLDIMSEFASNYPEICDIDTIGSTTEDRLIIVARISDNVHEEEDEPEFLYTSSMHGDETTGYVLTLRLIDYLLSNYGSDERITNIVDNIDIWINPLANPDGTYAGGNSTVFGATRYNANYVDLNRNYPDPADGPHPDGNPWQPETVAFMAFAEGRDFVLSANFHGGAEVVNYPWDTWSRNTADHLWWNFVSRNYADTCHVNSPLGYFTDLDNGVTNGYAWYSITGGRQDYMNYFQQCREVTLEISSNKLLPTSQLESFWNYNYRSMLNYIEESLYGVRGIVTDSLTGQPLQAEVFIAMHDKDSSMVYSSLPIGNYHRLLKSGTYNITFKAPGYLNKTVTGVQVADGFITYLDVQLYNGMPVADFTASDTLIEEDDSIIFTDNSFGSPLSRLWIFEGGSPETSTDTNPSIKYENNGTFDVTLIVSNGIGADTLVKDDYITVNESIGTSDYDLIKCLIYPNPVTGEKFNIISKAPINSIDISDVTGAALIHLVPENVVQLSISTTSLKNGIYLVNVRTDEGNYAMKILINR